jgi:hypothetical protein
MGFARGRKGRASTAKTGVTGERPSSSNDARSIPKGPLDAGVTEKIASCRRDLGVTLYADILVRVARVRSPRDVANQRLQQVVLRSMEICLRAMRRIREIATELPEAEFYTILDDLGGAVARSHSDLRGLPEAGERDACGDREIGGVILTQFQQKRDAEQHPFFF